MDFSTITDIVTKARECALNGDYCSALAHYEDSKAKIEKSGVMARSLSLKRMYDAISMEIKQINELINELSQLQSNVKENSSSNTIIEIPIKDTVRPAKNQSSNLNAPGTPPSKRITRPSVGTLRPRFTVDERGHRLQPHPTTQLAGRLTAPVSRQTLSSQPEESVPDTNPTEGKESIDQSMQEETEMTSRFIQQYKGPVDISLVRMLESEVIDTLPNVSWDSIAGLKGPREILEEAFVLPQLMPEVFQGIRRPWRGILLFGPPGTGKTMLAKAIAAECNTTFFNVTSSTLTSKWRGDSEKLVRLLFEMARFYAPSTVFLDEIDALGGQRTSTGENEASLRVKSELLIQMDGLSSTSDNNKGNVTVLGATNLPWNLDEALRRRFEKRIYIPLPDQQQRIELFRISLKEIQLAESVNLNDLAKRTEGYSGADISNICRDASMMYLRKALQNVRKQGFSGDDLQREMKDIANCVNNVPVTQEDLLAAIDKVSSSVGSHDLQRLELWMKEFGSS